jgi:hypothetical protein
VTATERRQLSPAEKAAAARKAGAKGRSAKPMSPNRRIFGYFGNTGRADTPAQRRRRLHKLGHLAALERRAAS